MQEVRNSKQVVKEFEASLKQTEDKIEALDERLLKERLTNKKFMQLYDERGTLMVKRRILLKKLENARKGKNPWGEAEKVIV